MPPLSPRPYQPNPRHPSAPPSSMPRHPPHPSPSRLPPRLPTPSPHLSLRFFLSHNLLCTSHSAIPIANNQFHVSPNPAITTLAHRAIHWLIHLQYQNSPSHIHIAAIQPTSSLYQPSPLQTLDSIDSRVNSYPFLPYFIHQVHPFSHFQFSTSTAP
ncbi:hypothetical protein PAPYR_4677 [Paratrimastix pyriformis]|uniref:Uncharacterized protein n=1 Tax=Paratrimastix pyriformis TaxID=342808 RepID=A0ABQ8UJH1_9EUKA|nr:hypothetical protein PAPYR_4677 [Paratrimastix pyriformis]